MHIDRQVIKRCSYKEVLSHGMTDIAGMGYATAVMVLKQVPHLKRTGYMQRQTRKTKW